MIQNMRLVTLRLSLQAVIAPDNLRLWYGRRMSMNEIDLSIGTLKVRII